MFEGFELQLVQTPEATIRVRHGGSGPPLLLLHGHPQTHAMWHLVAPALAERFTVVCADLRGYGGSSKPPADAGHETYSKRTMARDQVAVMRQLGFDRFAVAGHDRGGRVAYRMALDHPDVVTRVAVLDIIPTGEHFRRAEGSFALGYWHWFFLAQPAPFPESVIAANPDFYYLQRRGEPPAFWTAEVLEDYRRAWNDPDTIRAMCDDYRAAANFDRHLDDADREAGARISCPLLALWGARNYLNEWYDVLAVWREWADSVSGRAIDCGHYIPEERPEETVKEFERFFGG